MSVLLSPIGNGINFLTTTGLPLAGGQLYTYQAGSSTLLATYTDVNGLIPNTNPIVLQTDGRLPSELWFTDGFNYKLILQDANNNLIATYDNLYGILATSATTTSPFLTGMIMIWSGAIGTIPAGWVLCDGNNGAPDLRDRFIIGAGNTYSVAQTGGSADSIIVSHTHTATATFAGNALPTHSHQLFSTGGGGSSAFSKVTVGAVESNVPSTNAVSAGTPAGTVSVTNNAIGVSGTNANLPPYYALAFIYKS